MVLKTMLPVEEVLQGKPPFRLTEPVAPALVGWKLKLFALLQENAIIGGLITGEILKLNRFLEVLRDTVIPDCPMFLPEYPAEEAPEAHVKQLAESSHPAERVGHAFECLPPASARIGDGPESFCYWTIQDYAEAYRTGRTTPAEVAERLIAAVEEAKKKNPSLIYFISFMPDNVREQAVASTKRYAEGRSLSVLDGVPLAVKDDVDCLPHPSTGEFVNIDDNVNRLHSIMEDVRKQSSTNFRMSVAGTKWLPELREVKEDAVCVARLRCCGMIMVGKAVMQELGMGTTGNNPHYGTARNPHDVNRYTGGSSSGPAAIVSSGLCPVALGTDVGGSIRIPSSLCGVVGLKPTFGRTTNKGLFCVGWSMESCGPLAATTADASLVYAAMLGAHPNDMLYSQPLPPCVPVLNGHPRAVLSSLKLGKYSDWFNCVMDKEVVELCNKSLKLLLDTYGTETKEVYLPELDELRLGHLATVGSDYQSGLSGYPSSLTTRLSFEVRAMLSSFRRFTACDFIAAQKIRRRAMYFHMQAFKTVDIIVCPTTGSFAPVIPPESLSVGETDLAKSGNLMRFIAAPNFLGFPAISVPVGHNSKGLPIGLQLIGRPWQEATLLRVAAALEVVCASVRKRPATYYNMLE